MVFSPPDKTDRSHQHIRKGKKKENSFVESLPFTSSSGKIGLCTDPAHGTLSHQIRLHHQQYEKYKRDRKQSPMVCFHLFHTFKDKDLLSDLKISGEKNTHAIPSYSITTAQHKIKNWTGNRHKEPQRENPSGHRHMPVKLRRESMDKSE